ncbi:MAG: hypothetical protein HQL42_08260 [Alphaproteobacteria bacterium]|nr:hypothetical protein [Alphaproteobacteria bacterium]
MGRGMYRAVALIVGILVFAWGGEARADDTLKGFKGVRSITRTHSDSRCIGDPRTPLCAVETFMACWARQAPDLCKMVWDFSDVSGSEGVRYQYKFRSAKTLTSEDYGPGGRNDISQPGDVEIVLDMIVCVKSNCPFPYFDGEIWVLRHDGKNWRVVYTFDEGGDDND